MSIPFGKFSRDTRRVNQTILRIQRIRSKTENQVIDFRTTTHQLAKSYPTSAASQPGFLQDLKDAGLPEA